MPAQRSRGCTFENCVSKHAKRSKAGKEHTERYHRDRAVEVRFQESARTLIVHRYPAKDMNYVCVCGSEMLVMNSVKRHFLACAKVKDIVASGLPDGLNCNVELFENAERIEAVPTATSSNLDIAEK